MLHVDLRLLIAEIVRHQLIGKGREGEALYISLDLRMGYFDTHDSYEESESLHLLYSCPPHLRYVTVFSASTPRFAAIESVKDWKHECTHDSGWRDIRVFTDTYFRIADRINAQLERAGKKMSKGKKIRDQVDPIGHNMKDTLEWVKARLEQSTKS